MKILWHSADPRLHTGYARVTREVVPRLQREYGYDIAIQCINSISQSPIKWHGEVLNAGEWDQIELEEPITIYNADSKFGLNEVEEHFEVSNSDLYFTLWDTWVEPAHKMIPEMDIPYVSYIIVDHYPVPNNVTKQVNSSYETIAMSKFAKHALEEEGTLSTYIPHGVNHESYKPIEDKKAIPNKIEVSTSDGHAEVDLDNKFLIGMVAANMGDRKNLPNHMEAFKMLLNEVDNPDDLLMYIHTNLNTQKGYDLYEIQKKLGIPDEKLIWGHPEDYGEIGDILLNKWYNAFDIFVNCTYGESWGLTVTESMSAGTPVIASYYSSMPEQLGVEDPFNPDGDVKMADFSENDDISRSSKGDGGLHEWSISGPGNVYEAPHGLVIQPSVPVWRSRVSSKLYVVHPNDIYSGMLYYYKNQHLIKEHGKKAREHVKNNYTWEEHVVPKFDDVFSRIETILE